MTKDLPAELHDLAWAQDGVLTTGQALGGGLTKAMIRSRLARERWQRLQTGVYAIFSGPPGRSAILWAAMLRVGPDSMLSYDTAAELAGLTDRQSAVIHLTVSGDRHVMRIPGIAVHRSGRADQALHPVLALRRTRVEETVLDLAGAAVTADDACGWVTRALGRRLTTQARLHNAIASRAKLRWRRELVQAVTADWAGVHSSLEYHYVRGVERPHVLSRGARQVRARQGTGAIYRDVLYEEYALAVELDGRAAHPADLRWRDIRRDNAAAADGIITLRYGWPDVTQHQCQTAAQIARVLRLRGYSGFRGCSPACLVTGLSAAA